MVVRFTTTIAGQHRVGVGVIVGKELEVNVKPVGLTKWNAKMYICCIQKAVAVTTTLSYMNTGAVAVQMSFRRHRAVVLVMLVRILCVRTGLAVKGVVNVQINLFSSRKCMGA